MLNAGTDTVLRVGTGPGAFDVTSPTNSVTGLLPGVTITALKADPSTQVAVDVTSDSGGIADKMAALVAAANSALAYIDKQSAYDADTKTAGPLLGDSMARDLRQQVDRRRRSAPPPTRPRSVGSRSARDGTSASTRPRSSRRTTRTRPPSPQTMTSMSQQLAERRQAGLGPDHRVRSPTRISNEQDSISDYTKQIADFEDRMTLRQQTLQTPVRRARDRARHAAVAEPVADRPAGLPALHLQLEVRSDLPMTTAAQLRSRYARESVTTASPARLVTMLYDRLVRDLDDAELAISLADLPAAHRLLRHAQDIVQELSSSLDVSRLGGRRGACNASTPGCSSGWSPPTSTKDAAIVAECREVVEPLRDAWHEAANQQSVALVNSSWLATLDAFDQHLDLQSRLVDEGRYAEVVAFQPPAGPARTATGLRRPGGRAAGTGRRPWPTGSPTCATRRSSVASPLAGGRSPARRLGVPGPARLTTLRSPPRRPMGEAATLSS